MPFIFVRYMLNLVYLVDFQQCNGLDWTLLI
jgi:hypothetical protein